MSKSKKILLIAGIALDVAITVFLFVISIIMLITIGVNGDAKEAAKNSSGLVLFLLENTTLYFWAFVFPLFVLLAGNIIGLVFYVKKTSTKEAPTKLDDLSDEQKEALRQELLKDLMKDSAKEEPKNNNEE